MSRSMRKRGNVGKRAKNPAFPPLLPSDLSKEERAVLDTISILENKKIGELYRLIEDACPKDCELIDAIRVFNRAYMLSWGGNPPTPKGYTR